MNLRGKKVKKLNSGKQFWLQSKIFRQKKRYLWYRSTSFHVELYPNLCYYKSYERTTDENFTPFPFPALFGMWKSTEMGENLSWRVVFVVAGLASWSFFVLIRLCRYYSDTCFLWWKLPDSTWALPDVLYFYIQKSETFPNIWKTSGSK